MIVDNIKNSDTYKYLGDSFIKATEFINKAVNENLPVGKYEIDGDKLYAMVQSYTSNAADDGLFEAHKKYIDVQYIISGKEQIFATDVENTQIEKEYNPEIDALLSKAKDDYTVIVMSSGDFAVFYPQDAHRPGVAYNKTPSQINKIVVKIKI